MSADARPPLPPPLGLGAHLAILGEADRVLPVEAVLLLGRDEGDRLVGRRERRERDLKG